MSVIRIVTAADSQYYTRLLALIGSIIRAHEPATYTISVYDIGLYKEQRMVLNKVHGVDVFDPEPVNPQITELIKKHEIGSHRRVPGLYTWKPVAVKMEMDKFDQVLWMDAGTIAMQNITPLWEHTKNAGHFFVGCNSIAYQTPENVIEKLKVSPEVLSMQALNSSTMGITRELRNTFYFPAYYYAREIELFRDNGTAAGGDTAGRHDQTVFSIIAANSKLHVFPDGRSMELETDSGKQTYSVVAEPDQIQDHTLVFQSRGNANYKGDLSFMYDLIAQWKTN